MRILLLTDADVFAGTERHILDLAIGLNAHGATALVGAPRSSPLTARCIAADVHTREIQKGWVYDHPAIVEVQRLLEREGVEIVHAHNGRTLLIAAMACRRARRGKIVYTQHFLQPAHSRRRGPVGFATRHLHHWLNKQIDHTIAISAAVRDAAMQREPALADRITVVHNGIRDPLATVGSPESTRRALAIDPSVPLIVCAARLEEEKDIPTLIDALAEVKRAIPQAVCLVAGEGKDRAAIISRIDRLGLSSNVRLLGFRADVLDLIAAADLFVLPARAEPFGLVLLEAMSLSRPIVATDAGGPREIVDPDKTGLLVPPGSASAMAKGMIDLLRDESRRRAMGMAGRQRFVEHFLFDRMAQQVLAVYRSLAGASCASC